MRWGALVATLAGLGLAAWLLAAYGVDRILALLAGAGWGIAAVVAVHLVQMAFSGQAWRVIAGRTRPRPSLGGFVVLRWIREGANNLLPVAQIGGEVIAARLLRRRGVALPLAVAGTVADLTMEMLTQIAFTLFGLGLMLLTVGHGEDTVRWVVFGLLTGGLAAGGFVLAQWFGLARAVEWLVIRLGRAFGWDGMGEIAGLDEALRRTYRGPRRLALAALNHMLSWLLGGVEVCLALHFLGHDVGLGPGLVIESIGQALKAAGFVVPGALGVAEGGFIIVCRLYGISPEVAIALSLMKRLREVGLGVPALLVWQRLEARLPAVAQV